MWWLDNKRRGREAIRYPECVTIYLSPAKIPYNSRIRVCATTVKPAKCRAAPGCFPSQYPRAAVAWWSSGCDLAKQGKRPTFGSSESPLPFMWDVEDLYMVLLALCRVRKAGGLTRDIGAMSERWSHNQNQQNGPLGLGLKAASQEECSAKERAEVGVPKSAGGPQSPEGLEREWMSAVAVSRGSPSWSIKSTLTSEACEDSGLYQGLQGGQNFLNLIPRCHLGEKKWRWWGILKDWAFT